MAIFHNGHHYVNQMSKIKEIRETSSKTVPSFQRGALARQSPCEAKNTGHCGSQDAKFSPRRSLEAILGGGSVDPEWVDASRRPDSLVSSSTRRQQRRHKHRLSLKRFDSVYQPKVAGGCQFMYTGELPAPS